MSQPPQPDLPRQSYYATAAILWRSIKLGFKTLWMHRLRSLLTMLGIVFGVCSVISMLAIGEGASFEAREQIRSLGSTNIIVRSVKPPDTGGATQGASRVNEYGITYRDVSRIRATLPDVRVLVPARAVRMNVWQGTRTVDATIRGTVPWYPEMRNHPVAHGRFFTDDEYQSVANVAVIGAQTAEALFPFGGILGSSVRIGSQYYRVIGVMVPESGNGGDNANGNGGASRGAEFTLYVPLTAARDRFGETIVRRTAGSFEAERVELHEVTVQVADEDHVVEAAAIVDEILAGLHTKQDYEVVVPLELLRQAEETKRIFNIVLGAIAAISLIVGGIGIMNIMLASVTERTREIGIRRALGAKKRDIVRQFLVETVILSASGGVIGVAFGIAIPWVIQWYANMATIVTPFSAILAFGISALIGVVFGIYPALRAAAMDPVEALRHE